MSDKVTARLLQDALDRVIDEGIVAGVNVLVLQNGVQRWYAEAGMRSIGRNQPMTRDSIFRIYSMSKPIAAVAVMMLVERGLLDLGEPVSDFLPGFKDQRVSLQYRDSADGRAQVQTSGSGDCRAGHAADSIETVAADRPTLIRDLLTMTSGLMYPDPSCDSGRWMAGLFDEIIARLKTPQALTTVEIANRLGSAPLAFQPGAHWLYGTSADVIGAIVEVVSGLRFGDFLRTEIFEPLGMGDTAFYVPQENLPRLADLYDNPAAPLDRVNFGRPLQEIETNELGIDYRGTRDPAFQSGGAGLKSTVDDYAKFGQMLLNNGRTPDGEQLIQPATIKKMTMNGLTLAQQAEYRAWHRENGYGYTYNSFMHIEDEPGQASTCCNAGVFGWDGAFGTYFCDDPLTGTTLVLMQQLTSAGTTSLTRKVKNIVFTHLND